MVDSSWSEMVQKRISIFIKKEESYSLFFF